MSNVKNILTKKLSIFFAVSLFFCSGLAHSSSTYTDANVLNVGLYGNGNLFLVLDVTMLEPGCNSARLEILSSHPLIKPFMALALSAKSAGSKLRVVTTGCVTYAITGATINSPTIDTSTDGRMLIAQ